MEFDETYRLNNLIPIFCGDVYPYDQAITGLDLGIIKIPLMYKEYISSAHLLPFIPIMLFRDKLVALRVLYVIYTIGFEILFYLLIRKKNHFIAIIATSFLIACPMLFPYIRYGWAELIYGWFLALGFFFADRYTKKKNRWFLFLSAYSFSLMVNVDFYAIWIMGSIMLTCVILFPKECIRFLKQIRNLLSIICGIILGLFNYIYYNIALGFPALATLYNYIFNLSKYNEKAIDSRKTLSLFDSIETKIDTYLECIGIYREIYMILIVCLLFIYLIMLTRIVRQREKDKKTVFAPLLSTVIIFLFLLISPNAEGSHHLVFIIPSFCLTIGVGIWLLYSEFRTKKQLVAALSGVIVVFNFVQCNYAVNDYLQTKGSGIFTDKIFDLAEYIQEKKIEESSLYFVEWGFSSQIYFLSNGQTRLSDYTFEIRNRTKEELEQYLCTLFQKMGEDYIYIPVYYNDNDNTNRSRRAIHPEDISYFNDHVQPFVAYVLEKQGEIQAYQWFEDYDGSDILLLKIENIKEIKQCIAG